MSGDSWIRDASRYYGTPTPMESRMLNPDTLRPAPVTLATVRAELSLYGIAVRVAPGGGLTVGYSSAPRSAWIDAADAADARDVGRELAKREARAARELESIGVPSHTARRDARDAALSGLL